MVSRGKTRARTVPHGGEGISAAVSGENGGGGQLGALEAKELETAGNEGVGVVTRERTPNDANTPEWILERVRLLGTIGLDPCSNPWSTVGAAVEWSRDRGADGLALPWSGLGPAFVNPPYGRGELLAWAHKIAGEAAAGVEIVALTPADSRTRWTEVLHRAGGECIHLRKIVRFGGHSWGAPRPHAAWYFGPRPEAFRETFRGCGYWIESNDVPRETQTGLFAEEGEG